MKVRFTLEVKGKLKVDFDEPLVMGDYAFKFSKNLETGSVNELSIEISNIPREKWPTLNLVPPDPSAAIPSFPFEVNRSALNFWAIQPQFLSLEGYLSVFGLSSFAFETVREEWFPEADDPKTGIQSGFSMRHGEAEDRAPALSKYMMSLCIASSSSVIVSEADTLFLAYYRVANTSLQSHLYIDSFRYSYLCLECLFSEGKFKKNQVCAAFSKSTELCVAIDEIFFKQRYEPFERTLLKYPKFLAGRTSGGVCDFLVDLRGKLQHANNHTSLAWHPSRQSKYENEALCIFSLADAICHSRTIAALQKTSNLHS